MAIQAMGDWEFGGGTMHMQRVPRVGWGTHWERRDQVDPWQSESPHFTSLHVLGNHQLSLQADYGERLLALEVIRTVPTNSEL